MIFSKEITNERLLAGMEAARIKHNKDLEIASGARALGSENVKEGVELHPRHAPDVETLLNQFIDMQLEAWAKANG